MRTWTTPARAPPMRPCPRPGARPPTGTAAAEAALVEHYARLVRLSFLVLPSGLGRHRGVLAAHGQVQRALPVRFRPDAGERVRTAAPPSPARLPRGHRRPNRPTFAAPGLGLRLFPGTGEAEELALARALSSLSPAGRAAYALRHLERLADGPAERLLARVGVADPAAALAQAAEVERRIGGGALRVGGAFDPAPCNWPPRTSYAAGC
ncbi:hypothetical protein NKH77_06655 [Streptomyces sp. M19]